MSHSDLRVLAHKDSEVGRRAILGGTLGLAGGALLAGCGGGDSDSNSAGGGGNALGKSLSLYSFADYDNPKVLKRFHTKYGPKVTVDVFSGSEEMVSKLTAAQGTAGYDLVTSPQAYVLALGKKGVFGKIDKSKLSNFKNLQASLLNQEFDPHNQYSIPKAIGSVGFMYNRKILGKELKTWDDFLKTAAGAASGKTSMLDDAKTMTGPYFWSHGLDWNTSKKAELDACAKFFDGFGKHIRYFDSSPGSSGKVAGGNLVLVEDFSGDMRHALLNIDNPEDWKAVLPDTTQIWIDNWSILSNAPHTAAAYAFMNYLLQPKTSLAETKHIGSATGVSGVDELAKKESFKYPELVFFSDKQIANWKADKLTKGREALVKIWTNTKAGSGS